MKETHLKHVERFNIPVVPGSRKYCRVWIFDTADNMRKFLGVRLASWNEDWSDTRALATTGTFHWHGKRSPRLAEVYFYGTPGAGVVSHEFLHVVLGLSPIRHLRAIVKDRSSKSVGCMLSKAEEQVASTLAYLVSTFWKHWYKTHEVSSRGLAKYRRSR